MVKIKVVNLENMLMVEEGYVRRKKEEVILEKVYSARVMIMIRVNHDAMDLIDFEAHRCELKKSKSFSVEMRTF